MKSIAACAIALLCFVSALAHAEMKSIKCNTVRSQAITKHIEKVEGCSPELGAMIVSVTYTFDLSPETVRTPVDYHLAKCDGYTFDQSGIMTVTPSTLLFDFKKDRNLARILKKKFEPFSISRETLVDEDGHQCEIIEVDTSKNKI